MKSNDFLLSSMGHMEDDFLMEANEYSPNMKKYNHPLRIALIAAVVTVLLAGAAFAIYRYSRTTELMAELWTEAGEIEQADAALSEEQLAYIESRTAPVEQSVTSTGITVTLESVTCTNHELFCTLRYETDVVDLKKYTLAPIWEDYFWSNPDYGRIQGQMDTVDTVNSEMELCTWRAVPNDACITDGRTTLELEITSLCYYPIGMETYGMLDELPRISGEWNFTVAVPAMEPTPEYTVDDTPLRETFGIPCIELQLDAASWRLVLPDNWHFVADRSDIRLREETDEARYIVIEFYMKDGTKIPNFGEVGEKANGRIEWISGWPPLDPTTIDYVIIFDGETEIKLPLIQK